MLKVLFHLGEKQIKLNDTFRVSTGWVLVTQLCPTLFDPMDSSPPGSSVYGILQAKMLEWIAISLSHLYLHPRRSDTRTTKTLTLNLYWIIFKI